MSDIEQILVLPRAELFGGDWPQGYLPLDPEAAAALLERVRRAGRFHPRPAAEADPSLKQPIPYCLLRCGSEWFWIQRRSQGSEARLHGCYSVGLGGHIGPEDGTAGDPALVQRGLWRELREELHLEHLPPAQLGTPLPLLGLINDDSNPVGQVHFGLVFCLEVPPESRDAVKIREISKLRGAFGGLPHFRDLWQDPGRFESWSRLALEAFLFPPHHRGDATSATESV